MGWSERSAALRIACLALSMVGSVLLGDDGHAQTQPTVPKPSPPAVARTTPNAQQVAMPDADKIVLLLRSTMLTLNDALQTGNYTVLRDMGAPGFREANTAAKLTQIFAPLVAQGADLAPAAILPPQLTEVPIIDPQHRMLRLKGFFPGQPQQINFEMLYEPVAGRWRLFGISVAMAPAEPQARATEPASTDARAAGSANATKGNAPPRKTN